MRSYLPDFCIAPSVFFLSIPTVLVVTYIEKIYAHVTVVHYLIYLDVHSSDNSTRRHKKIQGLHFS